MIILGQAFGYWKFRVNYGKLRVNYGLKIGNPGFSKNTWCLYVFIVFCWKNVFNPRKNVLMIP